MVRLHGQRRKSQAGHVSGVLNQPRIKVRRSWVTIATNSVATGSGSLALLRRRLKLLRVILPNEIPAVNFWCPEPSHTPPANRFYINKNKTLLLYNTIKPRITSLCNQSRSKHAEWTLNTRNSSVPPLVIQQASPSHLVGIKSSEKHEVPLNQDQSDSYAFDVVPPYGIPVFLSTCLNKLLLHNQSLCLALCILLHVNNFTAGRLRSAGPEQKLYRGGL